MSLALLVDEPQQRGRQVMHVVGREEDEPPLDAPRERARDELDDVGRHV